MSINDSKVSIVCDCENDIVLVKMEMRGRDTKSGCRGDVGAYCGWAVNAVCMFGSGSSQEKDQDLISIFEIEK